MIITEENCVTSSLALRHLVSKVFSVLVFNACGLNRNEDVQVTSCENEYLVTFRGGESNATKCNLVYSALSRATTEP